eukprot:799925-Prorocentrum_minimum.AAC.1
MHATHETVTGDGQLGISDGPWGRRRRNFCVRMIRSRFTIIIPTVRGARLVQQLLDVEEAGPLARREGR